MKADDIANLDISSLPRVSVKEKSLLPHSPGIYFILTEDEEFIYIGRAKSIKERWNGRHHKQLQTESIDGAKIAWLIIEEISILPEIEHSLIDRFMPTLNNTESEETFNFPRIRIRRETRQELKFQAVKREMTLQDYLGFLAKLHANDVVIE